MAPEQRRAHAAVRRRLPVPEDVDGRADVYALGLLMHETLTGMPPDPGHPPAPTRTRNPAVPVGLSDIIARCLAESVTDRYPDAGLLAADLRRHLLGEPLQGVSNRSLTERWHRWRRRNPYTIALTGLLLAAIATGLVVLDHDRFRKQKAENVRKVAAEQKKQRQLDLLNKFEDVIESLRFASSTELSDEQGRTLAESSRALWQVRNSLLRNDQSVETDTDVLDLALIGSDLIARAGSPREALTMLREAEALFGRSAALVQERNRHRLALGLPADEEPAPPPRTAGEHLALGRSLHRLHDQKGACEEFTKAIDLEPGWFWPHFSKGTCAYQLGELEEAEREFDICVALEPKTGACYHNRGLARRQLGREAEAKRDLRKAKELLVR